MSRQDRWTLALAVVIAVTITLFWFGPAAAVAGLLFFGFGLIAGTYV